MIFGRITSRKGVSILYKPDAHNKTVHIQAPTYNGLKN